MPSLNHSSNHAWHKTFFFFPFLDNLTISSDDLLCIHDEFLIHLINYFGIFVCSFWVKFLFYKPSNLHLIWVCLPLSRQEKPITLIAKDSRWKRIGWFTITHNPSFIIMYDLLKIINSFFVRHKISWFVFIEVCDMRCLWYFHVVFIRDQSIDKKMMNLKEFWHVLYFILWTFYNMNFN